MTIEIKIPANALALQYYIGQALKLAAVDAGFVVGPESNADKAIGVIRIATAGEDIDAGQPVVVKAGEASTVSKLPLSGIFGEHGSKPEVDDTGTDPTEGEPITPDTPDADGIVWDKRIHSQGQTRNADGTWRLARKPKDKSEADWNEYVESVKAELLAVAAAESRVESPRTGPFYWSHPESDSVGVAQTEAELIELLEADLCCQEIDKEQYDALATAGAAADPVPPAPAADPVPPAPAADPVPPAVDPVPPAPAADPVPPAPAVDPVPPAVAQVDEQLTFGKMVAGITPLKAKIPADVDFNQFIADIAASMGIPVMNPKAPLAAFASAGPKVLSHVKHAVEGLING